ncbi:MAG: c-type cytochrome [Bacteroidales bacterium]|jgi:mono/diheme cytochrome c family protein|nr:c-type cytochrome [Bacteroidales bacterium]MDY0334356.1 c-type cytochrome [Bacteroidales bacterium]
MKMKRNILVTAALGVAFLYSGLLANAQDFAPWPVPDEAAAVENPVAPTKESLQAGKSLFDLQCKACHGESGKGDGLIKSANLTTPEFLAQTDGAIHYKIYQGRGVMPGFSTLPDEQLWDVINYVRSLSMVRDSADLKDATISLYFNDAEGQRELTAKVEETNAEGEVVPVAGMKVNFAVQTHFVLGQLPVVPADHYTNENGMVTVVFNDTLIGDGEGMLQVVASIQDMEYKPAQVTEAVGWGVPNPQDYWTERRALWKNNDYVPIWLLISFTGSALAIWLTIVYVALLVRKIKLEGDRYENDVNT